MIHVKHEIDASLTPQDTKTSVFFIFLTNDIIHIFQSIYFKATCRSNLHWEPILQLKGTSIALWQAGLDVIISTIMLLE